MQIMSMSSPSMSDAADTPISGAGESPSPQSPVHDAKEILDFSKKDGLVKCDPSNGNGISEKVVETTTTTESERSVNSSPATLVPTPRSTPPMNGILTPPNDVEGSAEPAKVGKPGGRLKFFKDGILCLELTHHGEGERTKWVQIRSKTVFPTLVHTVKEATIPCHSTPSAFASPTSISHNNRVESSTSHSLSDDASSMLSSPRTRESHWKQSVPQRGASACLQFYMKPAPCALKLRCKLEELSPQSQDQKRKRWPYYSRRTEDIFVKLKNSSVQCCCDESSRVLTDNSVKGNNNNNDKDSSDKNLADKTSILESKLTEALRKSKPVSQRKTLVSLHKVVEQLEKTAAVRQKDVRSVKSNGESETGRKSGHLKTTTAATPKKRLFNEVEPKESMNIRPKKKSPNRTTYDAGKTILNVPALNSEYYKRQAPGKSSKSPGRSPPMTGADVYDFKSSNSNRKGNDSPSSSQKRSNRSSPYFGAKSTSPGTSSSGGGSSSSMLKPGLTAELFERFSPVSGRNAQHRISAADDHLSPRHQSLASNLQEQKYLQQQTVSKAISYTINSLLGTGSVANSSSESPANLSSKHNSHSKSPKESSGLGHPTSLQSNHLGGRQNSPIRNIPGGGRPDDQTSFLRHLLDTSDPIPLKNMDKTSKNIHRSNISQNNNNNNNNNNVKSSNAAGKPSRPPSHHQHHEGAINIPKGGLNTSTSKTSSTALSNAPQQSKSSVNAEAQQNLATNIALSQLMSSFPLGLAPPYDLLGRSAIANPHSTEALTAAAAAAFQQYGSLLPGNFFNPVNNPMAAAMAASYFGMMPMSNFPMSGGGGGTPTPPPNSSQSSTPPPAPRSTSRKSAEPLHNQRSSLLHRPGMTNGHPPVSSPPFRNSNSVTNAALSQNSPARSSSTSAISSNEMPSCEALNLSAKKKNHSEEIVDMDAPLDLCKKSSR